MLKIFYSSRRFFFILLLRDRFDVALTYNTKPESKTFLEEVPSFRSEYLSSGKKSDDLFAEWDSMETVYALRDALAKHNNVHLIEADFDAFDKLRRLRPHIVFNVAEGFYKMSREAQIPAMLDMLNIPYTGSDPLTLSVCLDKVRTKEVLHYHGIPTAPFRVFDDYSSVDDSGLHYPLFVKPVSEGSSKGIYESSLVKNSAELKREVERINVNYLQPAIAEEYLDGREFTVAILGNDEKINILPVVELNFDGFPAGALPVYAYEAKWIYDTRENPLDVFDCPAKLDAALENKIKETCKKTFKVLNCKDWSRIDLRCDKNGVPNVIEINPLPGILPNPADNSCFPKAARSAGLSYDEMINKVLEIALERHGLI